MWNTLNQPWLRFAGSTAALWAAAIVLVGLSFLFSGSVSPGDHDAVTMLRAILMAFPALAAWSAITTWRPKSIWSHIAFFFLVLPALLLAETGAWRFGFGAEYYRYAVSQDNHWAAACTLCLAVGALGAYLLGVADVARRAQGRSIRGLVLAAVTAVVLIVVVLNFKTINVGFTARFVDWYAAPDKAFLAQRVCGYFRDEWRKESYFDVRVYGWGVDDHWRWSETRTEFKEGRSGPIHVVQVDESAREAMEDALNIAVRDRLWQQEDVKSPPYPDPTGETIEFSLGPHKGRFSIDAMAKERQAPHLRLFLHKLRIWMDAVRSASSTPPSSPSPN